MYNLEVIFMYVTRGTTPIHIFTLPLSKDKIHDLRVSYTQAGKEPIGPKLWIASDSDTSTDETSENVSIEPIASDETKSEVNILLLAEETLKFDPKHFIKLQLTVSEKIKKQLEYGEVLVTSGDIHKSDIIYLAVVDDLLNPWKDLEETE
jgi:hypothetical protein